MHISLLEGALGGIGLFLLGMRVLSDGIANVSNFRIRYYFSLLTATRFACLLFGTAFTCSINSGPAAIVFTIALLNGGVLTLFQSICFLSGVLLGAALLLYVAIVPYSLVAGPLVLFGVLLKFFARRRSWASSGDLLLGVGLLYLGLMLLEGSYRSTAHPLYDMAGGLFAGSSMSALVFGTIVSCLVQSGTAAADIVTSLAVSRNIPSLNLSAMISGTVLGMAVMGGLASIGGKTVARRVSLLFSVVLTLIAVVSLGLRIVVNHTAAALPGTQSVWDNDATLLYAVPCILTAVVLFLVSAPLSRKMLATGNGADHTNSIHQPCAGYLDARVLDTPPIALEQARKEAIRMIGIASYMFADVRLMLGAFDARRADTIRQHEQVLDSLNHEISAYLTALLQKNIPGRLASKAHLLLQTVSAVEHLGDNTEKLLDGILQQHEQGILYSEQALRELLILVDMVSGIITRASEQLALSHSGPDSRREIQNVRSHVELIRQSHFERICAGTCPSRSALLFNEQISHLLRIAELCWYIETNAKEQLDE